MNLPEGYTNVRTETTRELNNTSIYIKWIRERGQFECKIIDKVADVNMTLYFDRKNAVVLAKGLIDELLWLVEHEKR